MSAIQTKNAAEKHYRRHSPLHGRTTLHSEDLAAIKAASQPIAKAEALITQRRDEMIDQRIDGILREHQGQRKRYQYNQEAVMGLEHLVDGPLDPHTQQPLWSSMLRSTKGTTIPRDEFLRGARAILAQTSLYDPVTMGG